MSKRKKKKNKSNTPRRKRMNRAARLQAAEQWIKTYTGRDIVKGYAKWFEEDEVCAIIELRMLGFEISEDRLNKANEKIADKAEARRKRKEQQQESEALYNDCDGNFYYIAGYTSNGVPFGITWEQMGETPPWMEDKSF